jgi:hypothetical protein
VLQRELKPLIYESGIQLPSTCGLDPKSAQIHFEQGRFGVSAQLFLDNVGLNLCLLILILSFLVVQHHKLHSTIEEWPSGPIKIVRQFA